MKIVHSYGFLPFCFVCVYPIISILRARVPDNIDAIRDKDTDSALNPTAIELLCLDHLISC